MGFSQAVFRRHRVTPLTAICRLAPLIQLFKGDSMYPVHDSDAILLMATGLASKRRPADLVEIVAAIDLIHGSIPLVSALSDAFFRLSTQGLLLAVEGGYVLTEDGEEVMSGERRSATHAERLLGVKERMGAYTPRGDYAPVEVAEEALSAGIVAHRTAPKGSGRNLLMPKPKTMENRFKQQGQ